jgi:hypothetical protein
MKILYRESQVRWGRRAAIAGCALVGIATAWVLRPTPPDTGASNVPLPVAPIEPRVALAIERNDVNCDARCAVTRVIAPATGACVAAIEDLAGYGTRWPVDQAATPTFSRFHWRHAALGAVTLAGEQAEFRNAAGTYQAVEYECDFDLATLKVIEARARPRSKSTVAQTSGH